MRQQNLLRWMEPSVGSLVWTTRKAYLPRSRTTITRDRQKETPTEPNYCVGRTLAENSRLLPVAVVVWYGGGSSGGVECNCAPQCLFFSFAHSVALVRCDTGDGDLMTEATHTRIVGSVKLETSRILQILSLTDPPKNPHGSPPRCLALKCCCIAI